MPKLSQIIALISATSVQVVLGSLYTFGALIPYVESYLHYHGSSVTNMQMTIVFTAAIIMLNVGMPFGFIASKRLSDRMISLLSVMLLSAVVFISSFITTFFLFVLFYGLFNGFSIGFGYVAPLRNSYTHFPRNKGFAAGVCMSGFGFGSVIFNYIIVELVNPDNVKVDKATGFFPQEVANNIPFAFQVLAGCYLGLGVLGSAFIKPASRKNAFSLVTEDSSEAQAQEEEESWSLKLFWRKKAQWLVVILGCNVCFGMFVAFNYKSLAFDNNDYFKEQDHLITLVGSLGIFANGFCRAVWGSLFDRYSFKTIITIMNTVLIICAGSIMFAVQSTVGYILLVPLVYFCYGGYFGLFPTQTIRIFGDHKGTNMYWMVFSGFSLAGILQFLSYYLFVLLIGHQGYYYCMGTFVLLGAIGLFIVRTVDFTYLHEKTLL